MINAGQKKVILVLLEAMTQSIATDTVLFHIRIIFVVTGST